MIKLNRYEAFERMKAIVGPWSTWQRHHHLAYGLIRGVPYVKMERYCHDNILWIRHQVSRVLWQLGAWPDDPFRIPEEGSHKIFYPKNENSKEVDKEMVWVKPPIKDKTTSKYTGLIGSVEIPNDDPPFDAEVWLAVNKLSEGSQ